MSTSGRAQRSGRTPRFEHRTAVGDGDGPRRTRARPPPRPPALRILMELRKPGPALGRGPAAHGAGPGRGEIAVDGPSRSWPPGPALTAGFVAGLAVESHRPPPTGPPGRHGLLEVLTATTPPPAAPHPLEDPSERPSGVLAGPAPGLRPPTARRAPGRRHQAPACVVPAPARDRADPAPASVPCPSSTPSRTSPAHPPGDLGPGPHRATRFPCPPRPRDFRGQSHVRHRAPFAGIPNESRRRLA